MKVIFVSQAYRPSHDATAQLVADLAEALGTRGHEVHVLTPGRNYMTGETLPCRETLGGVQITRVPMPLGGKKTHWHRAAGFATFLLLSAPTAVALASPGSVVMYLSSPPYGGWSARIVRSLRGARTCLVAQDMYPDIAVAMGYLDGEARRALAMAIDKVVLRGFDRIVAVGQRMRERFIAKGIAAGRITVIENWALSEPSVLPSRRDNQLLRELGLAGKFVVQYSGNMGVVHDMQAIVDAAVALRADPEIAFLMIGAGNRRVEIERAIAMHRLDNITLLPYQPAERLPVSLSAADVALVSLRPELEGLVVPSKLYGVLAVGMPAIFIGDQDGEAARTIRRGTCGVTVGGGAELATAIQAMRSDAPGRATMGASARRLFEAELRRSFGIAKYEALIDDLGSRPS
jgi:glycosyltransferase involved in cell wall biosynthesis